MCVGVWLSYLANSGGWRQSMLSTFTLSHMKNTALNIWLCRMPTIFFLILSQSQLLLSSPQDFPISSSFFSARAESSDVWPNWNNHWILPADTFVSVCPMLTRLVVNFWLCSCRMPSHCGAWQMAEFIYARHREHSVTSSYLFFVTLIEKRVVRNDCGKWRGVKCTRNAESNRME